jgi:hypothetical protein
LAQSSKSSLSAQELPGLPVSWPKKNKTKQNKTKPKKIMIVTTLQLNSSDGTSATGPTPAPAPISYSTATARAVCSGGAPPLPSAPRLETVFFDPSSKSILE